LSYQVIINFFKCPFPFIGYLSQCIYIFSLSIKKY